MFSVWLPIVVLASPPGCLTCDLSCALSLLCQPDGACHLRNGSWTEPRFKPGSLRSDIYNTNSGVGKFIQICRILGYLQTPRFVCNIRIRMKCMQICMAFHVLLHMHLMLHLYVFISDPYARAWMITYECCMHSSNSSYVLHFRFTWIHTRLVCTAYNLCINCIQDLYAIHKDPYAFHTDPYAFVQL